MTKYLKQAKLPVVFLPANRLKPWSAISQVVKLVFLVAVYTASACGSFLSCTLVCVMSLIHAKSRFVGKHETPGF